MTSTNGQGHTPIPTIGQFAIVGSRFGWQLLRVESVTTKQFKGRTDRYNYKHTISIDACDYCGDEADARELYEKLVSSQARYDEECRNSRTRLESRNGELIRAALSRVSGGGR